MVLAESPPALWWPFLDALPVDGGSISVIAPRSGTGSTVGCSDDLAERLDALQAELGEGPRWHAFRGGEPVLVPDVRRPGVHAGWPLFGVALGETPARAVFSFPMTLGRAVVGVADLYSRTAGDEWPADLVASAVGLAAAAAAPAVRLAARSALEESPSTPEGAAELRREVHQATGMLIVHLGVPPDEALARLEAHAFRAGRPIAEIARDVVERRLDFREQTE